MPGLEDLFAYGHVSQEFTIKDNKVRLSVLEARTLQDALNASYGVDEVAKLLDYKRQVLARSITICNGVTYVADPSNPTNAEIDATLELLGRMHVAVINKLYDYYDQLDGQVKKNIADKVKK